MSEEAIRGSSGERPTGPLDTRRALRATAVAGLGLLALPVLLLEPVVFGVYMIVLAALGVALSLVSVVGRGRWLWRGLGFFALLLSLFDLALGWAAIDIYT